MSEPFVGQIGAFGFSWPPRNWALCDGQVMPVNQNQILFSLLGATFGGDAQATFALPDLRSRAPIHPDRNNGLAQGAKFGVETVKLTEAQIPAHSHALAGYGVIADKESLAGNHPAVPSVNAYGLANNLVNFASDSLDNGPGGGQGHSNIQPCLAISFCIALTGTYPSRS